MAWKTFYRIYTKQKGTCKRHAGMIITSATLAVSLTAAVYQKLSRHKVLAHAESEQAESQSGIDPGPIIGCSDADRQTASNPSKEKRSRNRKEQKCCYDKEQDITPCCKWDHNWDKRDPSTLLPPSAKAKDKEACKEQLKSLQPKATRHIILIRHGVYVHKDIPDEEQILTELGREQAEMTGQYLKMLNLKYTKMVSSTMTRAVQTANIIHNFLPELELQRDDILCEGRPVVPEPWLHWRPPYLYFQQGARIEAAFRKYFHRADPKQMEDSVEIIVCHANVIRYFVCRALQFPPEGWLRIALAHGSITHLMIRPSGHVYLHTLGAAGHMVPGKVTVSTRGQVLW